MFEMAGGRTPCQADSAMTLMMMHVNDPVPDMNAAGIPSPLDDVIERALAKDPDDRYQNAGEMVEALRALPATEPLMSPAVTEPTSQDHADKTVGDPTADTVTTRPADQRGQRAPWRPTRRMGAIGGVVAVLAVLIGLVISSGSDDPGTDAVAVVADSGVVVETTTVAPTTSPTTTPQNSVLAATTSPTVNCGWHKTSSHQPAWSVFRRISFLWRAQE